VNLRVLPAGPLTVRGYFCFGVGTVPVFTSLSGELSASSLPEAGSFLSFVSDSLLSFISSFARLFSPTASGTEFFF